MNWFDVVKQPKLRTSSNITTKLGSKSKPEEDDSCKRKLVSYENKINSIRVGKLDVNAAAYVESEFKEMPENVACEALKLLNGLQLKVFNLVGEPSWFAYNYPMEEKSVIVGNAVYYIAARYRYAPNIRNDVYGKNGHLVLTIDRNNLSLLQYEVEANGTKEEVMRQVDWR